jgi:hypothetical protein
MPDTIPAVRDLLQARLHELEGERQAIERALAALGGTGPRRRRPGRSKVAKPRRQKSKSRADGKSGRAPRGARRAQILEELGRSPGSSPSQIGKAIGVSSSQVSSQLKKAEAEGLVVKKGRASWELKKP